MLLPSSCPDRAGLRLSVKVSALPTSPTLRFPWRSPFSRLTYGSLSLTTCRLARPPCRSGPGSHPAYGDFYIRASSGLVTRTAAVYWQLGKFHWRDLLLTPARTPTSIAATQIPDLVGIELGRANYRWGVTVLALSIARRRHFPRWPRLPRPPCYPGRANFSIAVLALAFAERPVRYGP